MSLSFLADHSLLEDVTYTVSSAMKFVDGRCYATSSTENFSSDILENLDFSYKSLDSLVFENCKLSRLAVS